MTPRISTRTNIRTYHFPSVEAIDFNVREETLWLEDGPLLLLELESEVLESLSNLSFWQMRDSIQHRHVRYRNGENIQFLARGSNDLVQIIVLGVTFMRRGGVEE